MPPTRAFLALLAALLAPPAARAHESFLPLHHQTERHAHRGAGLAARPLSGEAAPWTEERFAFTAGGRLTRYAAPGGGARLWETNASLEYFLLPWLVVGGDLSYGWYESRRERAAGWLAPHAHVDLHLPLGPHWEVVAGLDAGFPGADAALAPDDWEWAPHVELRHDRQAWYAEAGVSATFVVAERQPAPTAATPEAPGIIGPEGNRELQYYGAFGLRLLAERLTLEARFFGARNLSRDTPHRHYLRAGASAAWALGPRTELAAEGSLPVTAAERNQWQASLGLRLGF